MPRDVEEIETEEASATEESEVVEGGAEQPGDREAAYAAPEPAGQEPEEPKSEEGQAEGGEEPARRAGLSQDVDHWRARATAHYDQLRKTKEELELYRQQYGQLARQHQGAAKGEGEGDGKPPEYDPDNPAPWLKWQAEENHNQLQKLQQMLLSRQAYEEQARQQAYVASIDQQGGQILDTALGDAESGGDPEFADAYKHVMTKSYELLLESEPTEEAAFIKLRDHNMAWMRERIARGEDPIAAMKKHASRIGWQPPSASPQQPAQQPRASRAQPAQAQANGRSRPADPMFQRPSTPRSGGVADPVPNIREMDSEEEFFDALDSGIMTKADVQRQLQTVLPPV